MSNVQMVLTCIVVMFMLASLLVDGDPINVHQRQHEKPTKAERKLIVKSSKMSKKSKVRFFIKVLDFWHLIKF